MRLEQHRDEQDENQFGDHEGARAAERVGRKANRVESG